MNLNLAGFQTTIDNDVRNVMQHQKPFHILKQIDRLWSELKQKFRFLNLQYVIEVSKLR